MSHHDAGTAFFNHFSERRENAEVETSALRNDVNRQSQLANCRHKLVWRSALVLTSFKGHYTAFDTRKFCVLLTKFIGSSMELQDILCDGIYRRRFDY